MRLKSSTHIAVLEDVDDELDGRQIVGESPAMREALRLVDQVAATSACVLILGETGTGKELIASAIQRKSDRARGPFLKLNCAAIPGGLAESELFGHEKGAFTGASCQKLGRFELADGGTLFLDEISELQPELQSKLLRVLQEHEIERVGGSRTIRVDVRVIAASNQDLESMVAEKSFRSDLYYRLKVFPIRVPPLRERPGDIPLLARAFTAHYARLFRRPSLSIDDETLAALCRYPWPGNVREMEHLIERSVILSSGPRLEVPRAELTGAFEARPIASSASATLEAIERSYILRVLDECQWVVSGPAGAAARLGLKRTSLQYKMQKLGISRRR